MWSFPLGSLRGIPIRVHITFPLILIWAAFQWGRGAGWEKALFGALLVALLFACVILHELGHSLVARRFHIRVDNILLLPFGGVARLRTPLDSPGQELVVALAGPLVNFAIGLALYPPYRAKVASMSSFAFYRMMDSVGVMPLVTYLFFANLALGAFNLLPAFPLDGGRVVRALLAYVLPYRRATLLAARVGQGVALLLGVLAFFGQPLLAVIAFFVFVAAGAEVKRVAWRERMGAFRVSDVMRRRGFAISADQSVSAALAAAVRHAQQVWPVVEQGKLVGLITAKRLRQASATARVREVMDRDYPLLHPEMNLYEAHVRLLHEGREAGAVVEGDTLVGLFSVHELHGAGIAGGNSDETLRNKQG